MRKQFFLAESHANAFVGFAAAVREAGGSCVISKGAGRSEPAELSRVAGDIVEATWPDAQAADLFGVGEASVSRLLRRARKKKSLERDDPGGGFPPRIGRE